MSDMSMPNDSVVTNSKRHPSVDDRPGFRVRIGSDLAAHVVVVSGELDLASRDMAIAAILASEHADVVVDMSELSFMDCAGFGALVSSRNELAERGGLLVLANLSGEPQRLLALIGIWE